MICVDSSVWIGRLRRQPTPAVHALERLLYEDGADILVGDLVLLEVLQGARDSEHAAGIERALRSFHVTPMMNDTLAVRTAEHYRTLRARGITIRKTMDLMIGTFCIAQGHALLHEDRDFDPMAAHLGLRVFPC